MANYCISDNATGEFITMTDASKIVDVALSTIRLWYRKENLKSLSSLKQRKKLMMKAKYAVISDDFNWVIFCKRSGRFCKMSSRCAEFRMLNKYHHSRFKGDGGCFR